MVFKTSVVFICSFTYSYLELINESHFNFDSYNTQQVFIIIIL